VFENLTTAERNSTDTFYRLLVAANIFKPEDLEEAVKSAKRLDVPLSRALLMLKKASDNMLREPLQAEDLVQSGKVPFGLAVKAIVLARQNSIDLADAINVVGAVATRSQTLSTIENPFGEILAAAELITSDQLGQAMQKSKAEQMGLGRTLVVSRYVTRTIWAETCSVLLLVRSNKISKVQAVSTLRQAVRKKISVAQVLFESNEYHEPSGETLELAELLYMSGLLAESDYLDCLEIEITKDKAFAQVVIDQGLLIPSLLETACQLLAMIGSVLKPFQAAEALRQVRQKDISVYQAMAELQPPPQVPQRTLTLCQLVSEAGLVSEENIDRLNLSGESTAVRTGKRLLSAGLLSEIMLFYTLRCYSLAKEGLVAADQAVKILSACKSESLPIDEVLSKFGLNLPDRMHWSWN
jgi:hypothetical protein